MKKLILAALLLQACGDQTAQELLEEQAVLTQQGGVIRQAEEKEIVVEYVKEGEKTSLSVADVADLPKCNNGTSNKSVWVKSVNAYFDCVNSVWKERAPEAILSPEVIPGEPKAEKIDSEADLGAWKGPMTGKRWQFSANSTGDRDFAKYPPCLGMYKLPSQADLAEAIAHGMLNAAENYLPNAFQGFWSDDFLKLPVKDLPNHFQEKRIGVDKQGNSLIDVSILTAVCLKLPE